MAVVAKGSETAVFELKGASLSAVALMLRTSDLAALADAMSTQFGDAPSAFDHDPVVIDLSALSGETTALDFEALTGLLRRQRLLPVAVRGGNGDQHAAALAAGLGEAVDTSLPTLPPKPREPEPAPEPATTEIAPPIVGASPLEAEPALPVLTLTIDKPLRSGQQVYAKGGDLIVLAAVNFGAEVLADGNIHVYGPLRGKAVAGVKGNADARIFSTCMEPELVSIAGTYRTTENPLPAQVLGKPAQIRLDGDRLVFEPLG
jgi:septum site-determining protein MinC